MIGIIAGTKRPKVDFGRFIILKSNCKIEFSIELFTLVILAIF